VTPVEIPLAAERLLRGPVYEPWVDEAGRGPGKKIPRIPERLSERGSHEYMGVALTQLAGPLYGSTAIGQFGITAIRQYGND
jgi:hypothetical protein